MTVSSTQVAAGLSGAMSSPLGGMALSWAFGTVAAVNTAPLTVNVYINNSPAGDLPSTTNDVPYESDYNPVVGDAVVILVGQAGLRTSYFVLGTAAGSAGGGSNGVPIGAIQMFPVAITYANWLLCNGGTFSAVTYPVLNTLLGGNTLPNLANFIPMGAGSTVSLGATAGSATANGLVAHTHGGPSHTHTEGSHTHTGAAHVHGSGGPHTHTYNEPASAGTPLTLGAGINALTINPGSNSGSTDPGNTASATPGAGGSGSGSGTGSASGTTGSTGSGSTFSVLNPVLGVAYFIRAG